MQWEDEVRSDPETDQNVPDYKALLGKEKKVKEEEGLLVEVGENNKELILAGFREDLFSNLTTKRFGKIIWDTQTGTLHSQSAFSYSIFYIQSLIF